MTEPENQSVATEPHGVTPVLGSCRQLTGEPASLMNPDHYPVEAICKECARPIRTPRFWSAVWEHIEQFTMAAPDS